MNWKAEKPSDEVQFILVALQVHLNLSPILSL